MRRNGGWAAHERCRSAAPCVPVPRMEEHAMSDDKQPMQADGAGTDGTAGADAGSRGGGESGGGVRQNPQRGKKPDDGFMGHGGQTELKQKAPGALPD